MRRKTTTSLSGGFRVIWRFSLSYLLKHEAYPLGTALAKLVELFARPFMQGILLWNTIEHHLHKRKWEVIYQAQKSNSDSIFTFVPGGNPSASQQQRQQLQQQQQQQQQATIVHQMVQPILIEPNTIIRKNVELLLFTLNHIYYK